MGCRFGWDCSCTSSFGIRRRRACECPGGAAAKRERTPGTDYAERSSQTVMSDARTAVVLLSGGMDSCVCAAVARERHGAGNVALLHASYGQRTETREAKAFAEIADYFAVRRRLMVRLDHFRAIGGSALTDIGMAVPEDELGAPGPH